MNPQTIQKLRSDVPEFQELIVYLAQKAREMDTLEGLEVLEFNARAHEASVRMGVRKAVLDILDPLLRDNPTIDTSDPGEYVV